MVDKIHVLAVENSDVYCLDLHPWYIKNKKNYLFQFYAELALGFRSFWATPPITIDKMHFLTMCFWRRFGSVLAK